MSDAVRRPGPAALNTSAPNAARMADYFLGGKDNFAADREAAERVLAVAPEIRTMAQESHAFLGRVVRYLVGQDMRQFVVLGSGLPTRRNVHQVAQEIAPETRVAYVATDPVVLSHARAMLATDARTTVVEGDVLHPRELLTDPGLRSLIDLEEPVAVLILSALQFIPDEDDPHKNVAVLREAVPVGSHFAIGHVVFDTRPEAAGPLVDIYRQVLGRHEDASRTSDQVLRFFDGLELVEPGLVYIRHWRPDNPLTTQGRDRTWSMGGIGRKTEG
ncbi:SAM-dependent methyltransferase [Streptosporangium sp. NPDC050855]|uniref:SAM-dependent methyltransferase n=1 Tax=Streptosporangium sp. NPDC050855 TaxID=3366194 RepID=UPI0037BDC13B